jgi:hypothetical protein
MRDVNTMALLKNWRYPLRYRLRYRSLLRSHLECEGNWEIGECKMLSRMLSSALLLSAAMAFCVAAPPLFVIGGVPPQQIGQWSFLTFQLQSPKVGTPNFSIPSLPDTLLRRAPSL